MDKNDPVFQEFLGYWRLSEEMIAKASKEDLAETARILAMQAAHMTRKFGEQPMPDYANLLSNNIQFIFRSYQLLVARIRRWSDSISIT